MIIDQANRGEFRGRRTDAVTFILERPGTVRIPDHTLTWFDLVTEELKTEKIAGRTFEVAPDPKPMVEQAPSTLEQPDRGCWRRNAALVVTMGFGWLLARWLRPWWKQVRAERAGSESAYFARFDQVCRAADPHAIYVALLGWLDHFSPIALHELSERTGDPQLTQAVDDFRNRLNSRSGPLGPRKESRALFNRAKLARRRLQRCEPFDSSRSRDFAPEPGPPMDQAFSGR